MFSNKIICHKPSAKYASSIVKKPITYTPSFFGFKNLNGDARGIKICLIDSGVPRHTDLEIFKSANAVDFTQSAYGVFDMHGHATGLLGILAARNSKAITGLAPNATYFFAKGIGDNGRADFSNVVASLLWCIVKQVDIIVMAFGCQYPSSTMHDAIKKVHSNGIVIVAAESNSKENIISYPAKYQEVISVDNSKNKTRSIADQKKPNIIFDTKSMQTLFSNNQFVSMNGNSMFAAAAAGCAAIMKKQITKTHKKPNADAIYRELLKRH